MYVKTISKFDFVGLLLDPSLVGIYRFPLKSTVISDMSREEYYIVLTYIESINRLGDDHPSMGDRFFFEQFDAIMFFANVDH